MNNGNHFSFTSTWKDIPELDQLARQISSFLFPKRRLIARCRFERDDLSVILSKEADYYHLLYFTKNVMTSDEIGPLLDIFATALDQIGLSIEQVRTRISLDLFANDFEMQFLERLKLIISKVNTHAWHATRVDQREFIMLKEAKSPLKENHHKADASGYVSHSPNSFLTDELTSEELSEFAQLGLDLRKIH